MGQLYLIQFSSGQVPVRPLVSFLVLGNKGKMKDLRLLRPLPRQDPVHHIWILTIRFRRLLLMKRLFYLKGYNRRFSENLCQGVERLLQLRQHRDHSGPESSYLHSLRRVNRQLQDLLRHQDQTRPHELVQFRPLWMTAQLYLIQFSRQRPMCRPLVPFLTSRSEEPMRYPLVPFLTSRT